MKLSADRAGALVLLLVTLLALAGLGGLAFYKPLEAKPPLDPKRESDQPYAHSQTPAPPPLPVKRTTFLLMGVDKRPDDSGRADTMIVVAFNPATEQLSMVSLPRDTWVQIPGHGYDKVNHAYAFGGEKLALHTAQSLIGIPIDHYVTLSFQGFQRIVDEIGGIDVDAEKRLYYEDPYDTSMGPDGLVIDIQPGLQRMSGDTALKYSRFRMDDEGDLGRIRRQQQVTRSLMKTASKPVILARIPQLIPALASAVETDLSIGEMLRLATSAKESLKNALKTASLGGKPQNIGGIDFLIPNLVVDRVAAYEVLIGETPSAAFLRRAEEDQAAYARALTDALEAQRTADEAGGPTGTTDPPEDKTSSSSAPAGTTNRTASADATTASRSKPKPLPVTVSLIDASGKNLGPIYVARLKAAGFRVARVARSRRTVSESVAIDHAGQTGTADRLNGVIPGIMILAKPDTSASEAVEIILGTDRSK